jgi:citronellol/citronellal dehydrogenase
MRMARTPAVYADAAYEVLTRDSREFTGRALLCEDVLKESGVTDFSVYSAAGDGAELGVDLFVDSVDPA